MLVSGTSGWAYVRRNNGRTFNVVNDGSSLRQYLTLHNVELIIFEIMELYTMGTLLHPKCPARTVWGLEGVLSTFL